MKSSIVLAAFALLFSVSASAQHIYKTNARQQARVHQGMRCGTITPAEHRAIKRQQQDVRLAVRVAKSDGVITPSERRIIRREQMQASNTIYNAKHNNYRMR
ncbi:MAG: TerB family tellurite resistance protein [Chitinophagaceae bacterium]|nr:TerB family tellurite resistance protein [Chitinophagaceae bacterium]